MTGSVSVFGLGYVGSVTAACLAAKGFRVLGVDVNPGKVELLGSGHSPIVEAGLEELVIAANKTCHLHATTDPMRAVLETEISLVCVGTPSQRNGKLDLSHVENVMTEIGEALKEKDQPHLVALRSTVLPGTTEGVVIPALEKSSRKKAHRDFAVCFNPEFIREGSAVKDFHNPPFTILGGASSAELAPLRGLYNSILAPVFETTIPTAEMVKYACNAFHALKVGFANEMGTLAKKLGVDTQAVMDIFKSDTRLNISSAYLSPGFAFGGSCLPKDLRALTYRANELDVRLPLLESILPSNAQHIDRAVEAVLSTGKKHVGVLGLSFKAGTDDLRESPMVQVIKRLLGEGFKIRIWDPDVTLGRLVGSNRQFIEEVIPHIGFLLSSSLREVVETSEAVLIGSPAAERTLLEPILRPDQIVIDLVNLDSASRPNGGRTYQGICW